MSWNDSVEFGVLVGKTITEITGGKDAEEMTFTCSDGSRYKMFHSQDCCESVSIDDIEGDLADLIGSPVTLADESTSDENPKGVKPPQWQDDSFTWTFYRLSTAKGFVTIRWYGSSNGYYGEGVDFEAMS